MKLLRNIKIGENFIVDKGVKYLRGNYIKIRFRKIACAIQSCTCTNNSNRCFCGSGIKYNKVNCIRDNETSGRYLEPNLKVKGGAE